MFQSCECFEYLGWLYNENNSNLFFSYSTIFFLVLNFCRVRNKKKHYWKPNIRNACFTPKRTKPSEGKTHPHAREEVVAPPSWSSLAIGVCAFSFPEHITPHTPKRMVTHESARESFCWTTSDNQPTLSHHHHHPFFNIAEPFRTTPFHTHAPIHVNELVCVCVCANV